MFLVPENVKFVTVEDTYGSLEQEPVQILLGKAFSMKLRGYRAAYPYGVLPLDSHDFIATHHLVCEDKGGVLEPLLGYKSVTLKKCDTHLLPFPGVSVLKASNLPEHEKSLQHLLVRWREEDLNVSYGSSWAVNPDIPPKSELRKLLKDLMTTMLVSYELDAGIDRRVCCGAIRMKTDQYFLNVGYLPLADQDGNPLPAFKQASLFGEPAAMFHGQAFSDAAMKIAEKYQSLWKSRVIFQPEKEMEPGKKAA